MIPFKKKENMISVKNFIESKIAFYQTSKEPLELRCILIKLFCLQLLLNWVRTQEIQHSFTADYYL